MQNTLALDALDRALLRELQQDASRSNQDLAAAVHASPATCLRRVRRLHELGLAAPDTVELLYRLRQDGVDVPLESLTVGECADTICRAFGGAEGK